jgi:glutaredoxin-like YruB-family protein
LESLGINCIGHLAHSFALDIGFFRFEPRGLELHLDRRSRGHFFLMEFFRAAAMKIIIYSTPACVYCKMLKGFLKSRNVSYEEKDVAGDLRSREEMIKKSHQMGVPVVDIDGEIFVGFNRSEIAKKLGVS